MKRDELEREDSLELEHERPRVLYRKAVVRAS